MQSEEQYDLDSIDKISALSSNNKYDKYEYLMVKIWVLSQALLNKQDMSILHWIIFLIKD